MMLWDRNGITPASHFPPTFELWQQYGGAFAGTPDEAREFVAREIEVAGIDTMNLHLAFGNMGHDNACRTAELFAAEVAPAFAEVGTRG
jgi:hypothetical protein